jgi:hypothetical protein
MEISPLTDANRDLLGVTSWLLEEWAVRAAVPEPDQGVLPVCRFTRRQPRFRFPVLFKMLCLATPGGHHGFEGKIHTVRLG